MAKYGTVVLGAVMFWMCGAALAGSLDSPAAPSDSGSAMYTVEDVYDRLDTGAPGAKRTGAFAEPSAGPGSTGRTLDEVMSKAPATNANPAVATNVLTGKIYWGLSAGEWAQQTGTMPDRGAVTVTPGTTQQAVQQGYHNGSGYVEGDADLVTGNIKSGVNIFGVSGDGNVVDTSSGDAVAGDLLTGKKAWVDGAEVTGNVPAGNNVTGPDGFLVITIPDGLYSGSKTATASDPGLLTGNIKAGANIFGVAGKTEVVDTTSADAAATDVLAGKKAWVDGSEVTGTRPVATLAKTGQTTVYRGGDDGTYQKGVAPTGARFTDNGDGTVTDNLTGLMWTKNANIWGSIIWNTAVDNCEGYSLAGHSDWRLPNLRELQSLIDYKNFTPALPTGHPFTGVVSSGYWSSTTYADSTAYAWFVNLVNGFVFNGNKTITYYVWPVRGGE